LSTFVLIVDKEQAPVRGALAAVVTTGATTVVAGVIPDHACAVLDS
jgi:hypothetical protein